MAQGEEFRSNGGGQGSYDTEAGIQEALRMLEVFASVSATAFDITHTNLAGEKRGFRPAQTVEQTRESIQYLVPSAARRQNNVIIRPRSSTHRLVQLDDLPPESAPRVAPVAFLMLQTSTQGVQAWVAIKDAPAGLAARLKESVGADREASGAVRLAGTQNFKEKYAPSFPVVAITEAKPGHAVTADELERLRLLAPPKPAPPPLPFAASRAARRTAKWPDYQRCLDGAPIGSSGQPKRTSADFVWCKTAISWGHGIEETAAQLLQVSSKARENGEGYALQTAQHAEHAARVRNAQPRKT